jgi:hypothetical protein
VDQGALRALVVTLVIEVPIVAALFPRQRSRMAAIALVANTVTNLTLNVGLPHVGVHGTPRILVGESAALVVEALAYALLSRPREVGRAIIASAIGNGLSFTLGGVFVQLTCILT